MSRSIKLWYFTSDCGDGSVNPQFFLTEQEALAAEAHELDVYGTIFNEAVDYVELNVGDHEITLVDIWR